MGQVALPDISSCRWVAVALLVGVLGACATAGERSGGSSASAVTAEQIQETSVSTAHEALQRLRPRWLRSRGQMSVEHPNAGYAVVFVDGVRYGDLRVLREINADAVEEMEFIDARDATTRYGTGYTGGIIMVTTRR